MSWARIILLECLAMQKAYSRLNAKTISGNATLIIALIFVTPLCGLIFQCGCDWPWSRLDARCNFYKPEADHQCPWCAFHGNRHILNSVSHYLRCFNSYGAIIAISEISTRKWSCSANFSGLDGICAARNTDRWVSGPMAELFTWGRTYLTLIRLLQDMERQ